ncbi:MAG: PAS domain-containing protein, partial [Nitrospirales bacterium]
MKPRQSADLLLTKRVFDSSPDFISVVDLQYRYQRVNPAYAQAFGIDQDEIAGLLAQDLFGKEIFENTLKPKFDRCAAGHEVEYESWFTFPNLGKRYLSVSYFPLLTEGSVIEGVIVMARDETERKVAQDEVKKSENQYRDLFDSAPLAYFATSFDGRIQMVNESAVKLLGYSREELIGESMLGLYAKTTYGREKAIQLQQQVQSGIGLTGEELQMLRKGGDTVWVSLTVRLIYDQNEQIVEHHGIVQDISEQKAREDELIKEQQRLQLINEIMAQINTGVTTDAIIKQTIEKLSVLFPIYRIAYSTISKNGEMEVLHSKEPKWLSSINGLNVDLNIASDYLLALRTRQSVCISDITKNPLVAPLADQLLSIH